MTHYCYLVLPPFQPSPKAVTFVGMKIQMHLITLFVTLSILGIFFFQGYWLWNQYTMESRQMHERIDQLFKQSIAEVLAIQVEDMGRDTSATARHGKLEIGISADSLSRAQSQPGRRVVRYYRNTIFNPKEGSNDAPLVFTKEYYKESYDALRLAGTAGIFEMVNTLKPIQINQIDSVWGIHLQQEGIQAVHFVDALFGRDTVIDSSRPPGLEPKHLIPTQRISTSMTEQFGLQGYIVNANWIIYKQMIFSFAASLLFVLITSACYAYLIRTILRQKTVAQIKNDFVNNMTHELKTPITVTYSAIDALQTFNLVEQKEKREAYFNLCKQQLKHLTELVEKILSMAVDERKNFRLQREVFRLAPLIEQLIRPLELRASKPVHIRLTDETEPTEIDADPLHLKQMLENLLDNAVKYSGEEVHIDIRIRKTANTTEIRVTDDGIGIAPSQQERIFERFYRVGNGDRHDVKGFGLGLSYAKDMAERHGGSIHAESREHHGSTFTLIIPFRHDTRITGRR